MARKPAQRYKVTRAQDGAEVRAELSLAQARRECGDLNAQARQQVGLTDFFRDEQGNVVTPPQPIYGSMIQGEISKYEIRSADGLVIS